MTCWHIGCAYMYLQPYPVCTGVTDFDHKAQKLTFRLFHLLRQCHPEHLRRIFTIKMLHFVQHDTCTSCAQDIYIKRERPCGRSLESII